MARYATFSEFYPFYLSEPATPTYPFDSFLGDWVMRKEFPSGTIRF